MAYDARTNELRELTRVKIPLMQGDGAEQLERLKEQKVLLDAIDKWAGQRSPRLSKLVDILESMNGSAEKAFYEETNGLEAETRAMFNCLQQSDVKGASFEGLKIVTQGAIDEDKLGDALVGCGAVAAAMDAIVVYNRELSEKMEALKAKWNASEKIAGEVIRDEQAVLDEIEKVLKEAAEIEADRHQNAREKFRGWVKAAKDAGKLIAVGAAVLGGAPPDIIDAAGEIADQAEEMVTGPWEQMAGDLESRKSRYEEYFTHDHASLLVMFQDTRRDAQDFYEKHDYTKLVVEWTSKARSAIDAFRSAAVTDGQKSDAEALASRWRSILEKAESDARSRWDNFVSENKSRFFGALSPDLEKALIGTDWDIRYNKIAAINLQGLMEKWIGDMRRDAEEIDWSDVPESWRGPLRERMIASLAEFAKTDKEKADNSHNPDALITWCKAKSTDLASKLR